MKIRRKSTKTNKATNTNNQLQVRKPLGFAIKMPLFKKKSKKPSQLEVVAKKTANQTAQFNDGISVITPVTGLPPEDHGRLNAMGMAPPPQVNTLYDIACNSNDEMSAITSGVPSPAKGTIVRFGNVTEMGAKKKAVYPPPPLHFPVMMIVMMSWCLKMAQSTHRLQVHDRPVHPFTLWDRLAVRMRPVPETDATLR